MKYLLDTNVVSDFLRNDKNVVQNMENAISNGDEIYICSIVYYEIVRGLKAAGKFKRLREFNTFYENYDKLYFDRENFEVVEKAIEIYVQLHKGKQIEDNDIFVVVLWCCGDVVLWCCSDVTTPLLHYPTTQLLPQRRTPNILSASKV